MITNSTPKSMKTLNSTNWSLFILLSTILPLVAADQVFFGNLHSHTSFSDGVGTPEIAYAHARDVAHLDFLAITEHNHLPGATRIGSHPELYSGPSPTSLISTAGRFTEDNRFVAIYGQEFSSIDSGNHANVLEVGEVIQTNSVPNGEWDDLLNTWLPLHLDSMGQPAVMLLNHPATQGFPRNLEYGIDDFASLNEWRTALDRHAHLINIVNGPSHDDIKPAKPSESEFLRYLNLGLHVAPTADQDNHRANWGSAANTRTGVIAPSLTKSNILTALRNRHVYATEDRNLRIIATVNGKLMGTRFQGNQVPAPNSPLAIVVQINDVDEPSALYTIDVYSDEVGGTEEGDVVKPFNVQGNGTHVLDGVSYTNGNQYIFLRITQSDDDHVETDRAWLAPVWFEPNSGAALPGTPVITLQVNLFTERAAIANAGSGPINLKDWTLVSVQGDQRFRFTNDLTLQPGQSVVVTSGPNAIDSPPGLIRWSTSQKWSNSGDPGQLLNPNGVVVAESH